ncbi:uncharacterized protein VNE69_09168 [Vairimorpha necatrix]|uniref:Uncharacterized protein n=1 Tax=Vairimorpha necatrix TaxID=6039 RepID=A0AAX4JF73_9MICR
MLQYFLLVFGTSLGNSENEILRLWGSQTKDELENLHEKNNEQHKVISNSFKKRYSPYKIKTEISSKISPEENPRKNMKSLRRYVNKIKQYNHELNVQNRKFDTYGHRLIRFYELLREWEDENLVTKSHPIEIELSEEQRNSYRKKDKFCCEWSLVFMSILQDYLPRCKDKIRKSSMEDENKQLVIFTINSIERAMEYYKKLNRKNIRYKTRYYEKIFYGNLISERLPYLFDHFDLGGMFIEVYELIIEQFEKNGDKDDDTIITLRDMAEKITRLIKYAREYLEKTEEKLNLLENQK